MRFSTVAVSLLAAGASALPAVNSATGVYEGDLVSLEPLGIALPQEIIDYFERHLPGTENATCGGSAAALEKRDGCDWIQCLGTAASLATSCAKALVTRSGSDEASCAAALVTYGSNIPAPCKACIQ